MTRIIERVEAYYEAHEVTLGSTYERHPAYTGLECECGEKLVLTGTSTITTCRCGDDHSAFICDIREREGRLRAEIAHLWLHNTQNRAEQRLQDEAAYPEDSPCGYNDIASDNTNDE
jgi:hypothetical protein